MTDDGAAMRTDLPVDESDDVEQQLIVLEADVPLRDSMLWDLQRSFFDASGASAWTTGGVPQYITTNPHIARSYARTVYGFLRDVWSSEPRAKKDRRPDPVIVELGAGSGQFAFNFLRALDDLHRHGPHADRRFTYVMTDFTPANVDFWKTHQPLSGFVESGTLDFALFDAAAPNAVTLEQAGWTLGDRDAGRPVIVIANYVFDSIPQELMMTTDDGLVRHLLRLSSSQEEPDLVADGILDRLRFDWIPERLDGHYDDDESLRALLDWYDENLFGVGFLLPIASLRCLDFFRGVTEGPMLALVGDRGHERVTDLLAEQGPQIGLHGGCFSLPVNFHALARWADLHGGESLTMSGGHASLYVAGLITGLGGRVPYETRASYAHSINDAGPDDFYAIKTLSEWAVPEMSLDEGLALLRWSAWDPVVFSGLLPRLITLAETTESTDLADLRRALQRVWEAHYPLPGGHDLAFSIASLLYGMEYYDDALAFLQRSVATAGAHAATSYNIGMAHLHQHRLEPALAAMDEAIELDSDFSPAKSMRVSIAAEIDAGG